MTLVSGEKRRTAGEQVALVCALVLGTASGELEPLIYDASETAFVLKQNTHLCVYWKALGYGLESLREFFLKASASA